MVPAARYYDELRDRGLTSNPDRFEDALALAGQYLGLGQDQRSRRSLGNRLRRYSVRP